MTKLPPERLVECLELCARVSGYVAIDVSGPGWPSDARLRRLAQLMADVDLDFNLEEQDAYAFLSGAALGFEPLFDVFPAKDKAVIVPILTTAALLVSYRTDGAHWWEYLDVTERALEDAAMLSENAFPAVMLLSRRNHALKSQGRAT